MSKHSEYNANQSLNETAKANKRMAHDARARQMPEYERPIKRKRPLMERIWRDGVLIFWVYLFAVAGFVIINHMRG